MSLKLNQCSNYYAHKKVCVFNNNHFDCCSNQRKCLSSWFKVQAHDTLAGQQSMYNTNKKSTVKFTTWPHSIYLSMIV